jgi:hypothetical protein
MKVNKFITVLALTSFSISLTYSQHTSNAQPFADKSQNAYAVHRFHIYHGTGYANSIYQGIDPSFIHSPYSFHSSIEMKYAYFFAPEWGASLGMGLSRFAAKGVLNMEGVIPRYYDPAFDPSGQRRYDLHYRTNQLIERQQIWAIEVPLQFHYEHHLAGIHGLFAGLGAKGYFPVSAQSIFSKGEGSLTTAGYDAFTNTLYTDPPHFGKQNVRTTPDKVKLNYSIDAVAELGWIMRLSNACDLYAGIYGSYGLMDMLPKTNEKKDFITPGYNKLFSVNSLLTSNFRSEYNNYVKDNHLNWKEVDEKWNRWHLGLKVGIHVKLGGR